MQNTPKTKTRSKKYSSVTMNYKMLELPTSFNGEVRLFPLPETVMFPRIVLPLHIFESRYREMFEDAMKGDHLITIATLLPGYEDQYYSRPKVAPTVCIGQVRAHERDEKGRYNLLLAGMRRAQVEYEIEPVRSFRRAMVQLMDAGPSDGQLPAGSASVVDDLVQFLKQCVSGVEQLVDEFQREAISLAALTDILAFHLPLDTSSKLQLLGETNPTVRAQLLMSQLPKPDPHTPTDREFPPNFSGN